MNLSFREIEGFTEVIADLLNDEEYASMQEELRVNPEKGNLIPGTGGARKIRARAGTKGKSGSVRVIYYYQLYDTIWLLDAYAKSKKDNLTEKEKKIVRSIVEAIKEGRP
jgi:hypothetical protein